VGYSYNSTQTACTIDCSPIIQCLTCTYNGTTQCLTCNTGYYINNATNTCDAQCGDGIRVSSEGCDDGNTNPSDGCSATCTVETSFFCIDTFPNPSTCWQCLSNCALCSSNTSCTNCSTGYAYNSSQVACTIDCSPIAQCLTCSYNGTTQCLTCNTGYHINNATNTCDSQCGDGVRIATEGCDDGNTNSNDGCSANCTIESGYYCADTFPNASLCNPCLSFCVLCTSNVSCTNCSTGYAYNSSQTACTIDCSPITQCLTCNYNGTTQCLTCNSGYHVNNATNTCDTQCGDGFRVGT
jgi:cysteine-rich repeat protein